MTTINYVDTFPGMGKTYWAKHELARRIREREGVTIYVGPTIALLAEVVNGVRSLVSIRDQGRIRLLHSGQKILNASVVTSLRQSMGEASKAKLKWRPMESGSVILCTHEAFFRLPMKLKTRNTTRIIFDEAKKCAAPSIVARMSNVDALLAALDVVKLDNGYVQVNGVADKEALRNVLTNHPRLKAYMRQALKASSSYQLYFSCSDSLIRAHVLLMPERVFSGWFDVYLMSAYLTNSQMWALLLRHPFQYKGKTCTMQPGGDPAHFNGYRPVPTKAKPMIKLIDATRALLRNHDIRTSVLRDKYRNVEIVYLTANETTPSKRKMQSILVPPEHAHEVSQRYRKILDDHKLKQRDAMPGILMTLEDEHMAFTESRLRDALYDWSSSLPEDAQLNPLIWMVRASLKIYDMWRNKHQLSPKRLLVAANKDAAEVLELSSMANNIRILPMQPHGQNGFQESDAVLFTSAINPTRHMTDFFNAFVPWYSHGADYEGDAAIQAVTRCSVRDLSHDDAALILVPDIRVARGLQDMMQGAPTIKSAEDYGLPSLVSMPVRGGVDETRSLRQERYRKKPEVRETRRSYAADYREHAKASPHYKELNSARVMMSKARARDDHDRAEALAKKCDRLAALQSEWLKRHPFVRQ